MDSTYSVSSLDGLVSSKRRLHLPPNSAAIPKSRQIALAWPMCRYPFGSGGKRVCTRPPCLPVLMSSMMMSRIKLDRPADSVEDSTVIGPESDSNEFICKYYLLYEHIEAEWPIGYIQKRIIYRVPGSKKFDPLIFFASQYSECYICTGPGVI